MVLERTLGLEGRLAIRQLERRPARTSLTVGILSIAMFVGISVGHGLTASVRDIRDWIDRVATADFYVRGTMPDGAYAITMAVLPEKLEAELARLDGVERVDKLNWVLARAHGERVVVLACTVRAGPARSAMDLVDGDPQAVRAACCRAKSCSAPRWPSGCSLKSATRSCWKHATARGRCASPGRPTSTRSTAWPCIWNGTRPSSSCRWRASTCSACRRTRAKTADRGRGPGALCRGARLLLQSQARAARVTSIRRCWAIVGLVWALLAMVFVVASLGIVNTLTMNVLEQTRELGMLRAVGLQRRQLRKLILAQALAVGLMSVVPGTVIGLALAYVINLLSQRVAGPRGGVPDRLRPDRGLPGSGACRSRCWPRWSLRRAARLQVVQALQVE